MTQTDPGTPLLKVEALTRRFPGVLALDDVSLEIAAGEVHILLGENGAGKSTLIKILAGVQPASSGRIVLGGDEVNFGSPRDARAAGVSTVFQELSLVPTLTVAENLYLGRLPQRLGLVDKRRLPRLAHEALSRIGADIPLHARAGSLPRSSQQLVEIAKGLIGDARLLILDEPTASLGEQESDQLLALVQKLSSEGLAVIYITHRLREIAKVGHHVTVLRDGRRVGGVGPDEIRNNDRLVELMTGRRPEALYPRPPRNVGPERLLLEGVHSSDVHGVDLHVRGGEIVGIAGLLGSGKSTVGRACFGLDKLITGSVVVDGRPLRRPTPSAAIARGLVYYPSDRRHQGLALCRPLYANVTLGSQKPSKVGRWGFVDRRRELQVARDHVQRVQIRPAEVERRTELFSGGNQQKIVLARGLLHDAAVHVFDEPTVGIDVNAKADVYRVMNDLAAAGKAVVLISSDLPEILGMADRVYVMHEGRVSAHLEGADITESAVLASFFTDAHEEITP